MATKTYHCQEFPSLTIAGVCKFENGEYRTASIAIQSKIEQTQSFNCGTVKLIEAEVESGPAAETTDLIPGDLVKMRKLELQEVAESLGIEYGPDATRPDLISVISAELRRG